MTDFQHEALLEGCIKSPAKILISGYPSDLYEDMLHDWNRFSVEVRTNSTKTPRAEVLWWNYDTRKGLFDV